MAPVTVRELAELVIEVLDAQKAYFKSRVPEDLTRCKQMEGRLRRLANDALNPPPANLFNPE